MIDFGLGNGAQTFQRLMYQIFNNVSFLFIYIDPAKIGTNSEMYYHVNTTVNTIFDKETFFFLKLIRSQSIWVSNDYYYQLHKLLAEALKNHNFLG